MQFRTLKANEIDVRVAQIDKNWCTAIRERLELVSDIDICQFEGYTLMKGSGKKKKEVIEAPSLF